MDWVGIANQALSMVGNQTIITQLTENKTAARLINANYEAARDEVLAAHPWNVALYRAELAADSVAPAFGYSYQYTLPSEPYAYRVWQLDDRNVEFKVEGRKILTDQPAPLQCQLIVRVTDPEQFPPMLTTAIAAKIAERVAYALTNSRAAATDARENYLRIVKEAKKVDAQEGTPDPVEGGEALEVRI